MQLKRDTDYALRLLQCMAKNAQIEGGVALFELCRTTGVPKTVAERLCRRLTKAKMITLTDEERLCFEICAETQDKTILDVIQAVEGNLNLFAVFDQSTELYKSCKELFAQTEENFANSVKNICIGDLLGANGEKSR